MKKLFYNPFGKLTRFEWMLWIVSVLVIGGGFLMASGDFLTLSASLIGVTALIPSTISVATSFAASALVFYRSPYYGLAYAANDLVLIVLWILAAMDDPVYVPMVLCFAMFMVNDLYGFINWMQMRKRQKKAPSASEMSADEA